MFRRVCIALTMFFCFIVVTDTLHSDDGAQAQAELRFSPAGNAEKNAGVWVDGYYVGIVKTLNGSRKVLLLPGIHEIVVRQAWYQDYVERPLLQPGKVYNIKLSMVKDTRTPATSGAAELKISVTPSGAAVFMDGQFAGHSDEFDGVGRAMLVPPGRHKLSIALPGYLPFETILDLRAHQKVKIEAKLVKGSVAQAGPLVSPK